MHALGYTGITQVITETGLDASAEDITKRSESGAFKSAEPFLREVGLLTGGKSLDEYYAEELWYAEQQYRVYPDVIGATIFSYGGNGWPAFNIQDTAVLEHLETLLRANPNTGTPPVEPQPQFCSLTPSKDFAVNIRAFPDTAFAPESIVGQLASGATARVYGKFADAENRLWYLLNEAKTQWISSNAAVRLIGACTDLPTVTYPDTPPPPPDDIESLKKRVDELTADLQAAFASLAAKELRIKELDTKLTRIESAAHALTEHLNAAVREAQKIVANPS